MHKLSAVGGPDTMRPSNASTISNSWCMTYRGSEQPRRQDAAARGRLRQPASTPLDGARTAGPAGRRWPRPRPVVLYIRWTGSMRRSSRMRHGGNSESTAGMEHADRLAVGLVSALTYGRAGPAAPHMIKWQVYFHEGEFELLQSAAKRSGRSVAELVREAVRRVWLRPTSEGPVGLWDAPTAHNAMEHDTIYDRVE